MDSRLWRRKNRHSKVLVQCRSSWNTLSYWFTLLCFALVWFRLIWFFFCACVGLRGCSCNTCVFSLLLLAFKRCFKGQRKKRNAVRWWRETERKERKEAGKSKKNKKRECCVWWCCQGFHVACRTVVSLRGQDSAVLCVFVSDAVFLVVWFCQVEKERWQWAWRMAGQTMKTREERTKDQVR